MSCFICKHGKGAMCNAAEAEIRCFICGRCEAEALLAAQEAALEAGE